jgi:hypothetical protein
MAFHRAFSIRPAVVVGRFLLASASVRAFCDRGAGIERRGGFDGDGSPRAIVGGILRGLPLPRFGFSAGGFATARARAGCARTVVVAVFAGSWRLAARSRAGAGGVVVFPGRPGCARVGFRSPEFFFAGA